MNLNGINHWKSTILGVITIMMALGAAAQALLDSNPATNVDPTQLMVQITAGITLLKAQYPVDQKG